MQATPEALSLMQSKLATMIGMPSGYVDTLPKVVKRRIKALKKLQVEALKIESKLAQEIFELEIKYATKFEPIWNKRKEIIGGIYEPNDDECDFPSDTEDSDEENAEGQDADGETKKPKKEEAADDSKDAKESEGDSEMPLDPKNIHGMDENTKGIPEFWLTILKNVYPISDNIQPHDEPILVHLIDVTLKQIQEPPSFTLEFHFSPNEYFTNSILTKTYEVASEVDPEDPFSFEGTEIRSSKGCTIDWKKGKNVTLRTIQKKQKHKTKGSVRSVHKTVKADSFFNFFDPVTITDDDDIDEETHALMQADLEIGELFKQRLIPRAVLYFTGEALDDDDDYDDDEEDEEDDEDDDDDDDDDDDEGAPEGPQKKVAFRNGKRAGGKGQPECQQQ